MTFEEFAQTMKKTKEDAQKEAEARQKRQEEEISIMLADIIHKVVPVADIISRYGTCFLWTHSHNLHEKRFSVEKGYIIIADGSQRLTIGKKDGSAEAHLSYHNEKCRKLSLQYEIVDAAQKLLDEYGDAILEKAVEWCRMQNEEDRSERDSTFVVSLA